MTTKRGARPATTGARADHNPASLRIVVDMQGAQSSSGKRGIGRYTLDLVTALVKSGATHSYVILLNGMLPDHIRDLTDHFRELVPEENICTWSAVPPTAENDPRNAGRNWLASTVRQYRINQLTPDVVIEPSLFEGFADNAVTSATPSKAVITAAVLYDLIPLVHPEQYLVTGLARAWYARKLEALRAADLLFAISEHSRQEAIDLLGMPEGKVVNIAADAQKRFAARKVPADVRTGTLSRYRISRPFVMYTAGVDQRKNVDGLIRAYALLSQATRARHQLVIVCATEPHMLETHRRLAVENGLSDEDVIFTGFVPDDELAILYRSCRLFAFPSKYEGFGLPVLEAMRCGAPVIAANNSSLVEIVGCQDAMFDAHRPDLMAEVMDRGLTNRHFRQRLVENGKAQQKKFSWEQSASRLLRAVERAHAELVTVSKA